MGKTTSAINLGIGLARKGKKVLLIDSDGQGSLTASLGYHQPDAIEVTLATILSALVEEEEFAPEEGILHHQEGVDFMPANIELSGLEVSLVNIMSRETILRQYIQMQRDRYMPIKLKSYIQKKHSDFKSDLFSVFTWRVVNMTKENGHIGLLMPYVWMFISSYEKMRDYIYTNANMTTLVQLEYNAFEAACVPVAALTLCKTKVHSTGEYIRLSEFKGAENQAPKTLEAVNNPKCGYRFTAKQDNYVKIPGSPVAYWVNNAFIDIFDSHNLGFYGETSKGIITGDNARFLRLWFEVSNSNINFKARKYTDAEISELKWYPCNKGGEYRKWYGNNEYIINWMHNGVEIMQKGMEKVRNCQDYKDKNKFIPSITWTSLSSSEPSFRYSENALSESAGMTLFIDEKLLNTALGFLNSIVAKYTLNVLNPTLNYTAGSIAALPLIMENKSQNDIQELVKNNTRISKADWDAFENSWEFSHHPLVRSVSKISEAFMLWEKECEARFINLKQNEENLNRLFIGIYGLQNELKPEVDDKNVTIRKAELLRDIKSFISYAVGCMFGRYSLDIEGLAYAGGKWNISEYSTYAADKDNIIPICDDEYFEDDIVGRFIDFVRTVYGAETLEENLRFIADAIGGKGQPKEVLRNYFLNDFYKDHCKIYQKRPIYWLFDSGKKNGFKALIYMHRYQPDTIARIRTDYVHEQQSRYRTAIEDLEQRAQSASTSERVKLNKRLKLMKDQATEIQTYEEKIHHLADQFISIDFDDGVKINYAKFQDVLAKIK